MSNDKYDYEAELKAAKRAEIERLWFAQEATNKELLEAYKALDVKESGQAIWEDLDTSIAETFIHQVFNLLYGDKYQSEGWSYDDALEKIKNLKQIEPN